MTNTTTRIPTDEDKLGVMRRVYEVHYQIDRKDRLARILTSISHNDIEKIKEEERDKGNTFALDDFAYRRYFQLVVLPNIPDGDLWERIDIDKNYSVVEVA